MQQREHEEQQLVAPGDPQSQPLQNIPPAQNEESDDPDEIFIRAVAEIDTQPLPKRKRTATATIADVFEILFLVSVLGVGFFGMLWSCISYPHTLVILYARAKPASITATFDLAKRTLAPVTITRSATTATTGTGHQDARVASGILKFYNGNANPQMIPGGTVLQGHDGVKVATSEAVTLPAANLPQVGEATVSATALLPGSHGNIAAFDVNMAPSSDVKVRNETPFTNGRDARSYRAVAPQDLTVLTSTLYAMLTQAFTTAFPIQQGEAALPTQCHTTSSANHHVGQEAQSVTLTGVKTCSVVAYKQQQLEQQATAAFRQTKPAANYHLVGSVQTTVQRVSPLSVTISGKWVYTFSPDYEDFLAQQIAGDSPARAKANLLKTGVIADASVPSTLPAAMYINFLVLVG